MHPSEYLPQPLLVLSSRILCKNSMVRFICKGSCIFPCAFSWSEPPLPSSPLLICREYLPVLKVSVEFPGNKSFHELLSGVLNCEGAISIQLVVVLPWFGNRFQKAVCPVFRNIAFVGTFLVHTVQLSPVLFF